MIILYALSALSVTLFLYNVLVWLDLPHDDIVDKLSLTALSLLVGSVWIIIPLLLLILSTLILIGNSIEMLWRELDVIRNKKN